MKNNIKINPFIQKRAGDKIIIIPVEDGVERNFIEMDELGIHIIQDLKEGSTIDDIINKLQKQFPENTDEIENDINELILFMNQYGLISVKCKNDDFTLNLDNNLISNEDYYEELQQYYYDNNIPFKFFIELTYNCNLRCPHCYVQEEIGNKKKFMSKELIFHTIDKIVDMDAVEVVFTGGEATLHPDIIEILDYATQKNILVTLLTNGINLTQKCLVEKIKKFSIYDVRVSIYGNKEYHNKFVKRNNSFEESINSLKELRKEKGIGTGIYVITRENYLYFDEVNELCKQYNIPLVVSPIIMPTAQGNKEPIKYRLTEKQLKEVVRKYIRNFKGSICTAGISRFRISPTGEVNPCEMMRHVNLGNINECDINSIMNSLKRKEWIDYFKDINDNSECNNCNARSTCNYCPGLFYVENKSFLKKSDFLCEFTKIKNDYVSNRVK